MYDSAIEYAEDLKLLFVEDNIDARKMTTMLLEDFFKDITVAENGLEAYEIFLENDFDIVITDINMPKMNGLELCKKIREKDKDISLVVLSAHNEADFLMSGIELGIDDYILKPINLDHLLRVIAKVGKKYKYIADAKENLNLLENYQRATNLSSIVSKANLKGIITYVNDAFCTISGYSREELIGKNHNIVRHPDNSKSIFQDMWTTIQKKEVWKGVVRNLAKDGKSYYVDSLVMPILDSAGDTIEYISLRNDITSIMNPLNQLQIELKNASYPLLVYLKLDNYEIIEDFYDEESMSDLQDEVYKFFESKFSNLYTFEKVYSLENGEYAFVLDATQYIGNIKKFIDDLKKYQIQMQDEKLVVGSLEYHISTLISYSYDKKKILESVKLGIQKLQKSKENLLLANNLAQREHEKARENMKKVSMIQNAIYDARILSYFQPIIDNNTQEIVKYESLVRLVDEDKKVLSPFFFLDIAKKSSAYLKITQIVLEHSFAILNNSTVDISINLSALDIESKNMRKKILEFLRSYKDEAHRVVFELLEDEGIRDFEVVKKFITEVKKYGVKIAIDDFGAGYSNYERLLDYQPDILKIDGCLIRDIETSSYSLSAVKSIVTFAKEQNLQTVAEFIENEKIYEIVKDLGIDFSQGYYFGKPEPLNFSKSVDNE